MTHPLAVKPNTTNSRRADASYLAVLLSADSNHGAANPIRCRRVIHRQDIQKVGDFSRWPHILLPRA